MYKGIYILYNTNQVSTMPTPSPIQFWTIIKNTERYIKINYWEWIA